MKFLTNLCLVVVSLLGFAVVCELGLRQIAFHLPKNYHEYLPSDVAVLAQYSKQSVVPTNYVALLGDSYAQGAGDWYHETHSKLAVVRSPFHSADVIFDRTCADVVSFGSGGAGSFSGLVYRPITLYERLRARGYPIEQPRVFVIYFYEGNDLDDNKRFLSRYASYFDGHRTAHDAFEEILRAGPIESIGHRLRSGQLGQLFDRFYLSHALAAIIKDLSRWLRSEERSANRAAQRNRIKVNGEVLSIPPLQQSPPLNLDETEIVESMHVFYNSIQFIKSYFPNIDFLLVYIPSPLSVYELDSQVVSVQPRHGGPARYDSRLVHLRSDEIAQRVMKVARDLQVTYLDFRPTARAAGRNILIHGPRDWKHFNRAGYELLGEAVAEKLAALGVSCPSDRSATGSREDVSQVHDPVAD